MAAPDPSLDSSCSFGALVVTLFPSESADWFAPYSILRVINLLLLPPDHSTVSPKAKKFRSGHWMSTSLTAHRKATARPRTFFRDPASKICLLQAFDMSSLHFPPKQDQAKQQVGENGEVKILSFHENIQRSTFLLLKISATCLLILYPWVGQIPKALCPKIMARTGPMLMTFTKTFPQALSLKHVKFRDNILSPFPDLSLLLTSFLSSFSKSGPFQAPILHATMHPQAFFSAEPFTPLLPKKNRLETSDLLWPSFHIQEETVPRAPSLFQL